MTAVRTAAGIGVGTALLSALAGCSSNAGSDTLTMSASSPSIGGSSSTGPVAAPADSIFGRSAPVSIARWWKEHPDLAPADLAGRKLLLNQLGTGPRRFPGPDMRKYSKVMMIITCSSKAEYSVRLQVLDGLSIASTAGDSCGGPNLSSYVSPPLTVVDPKTEVEVEVPEGTKYYVTLYGTAAQ